LGNYFIQPTAYSVSFLKNDNASGLSGFDKIVDLRQSEGSPHIHPNTIAHASWGYHLYALIKHIIYSMNQS
jgi:hypothetical protein